MSIVKKEVTIHFIDEDGVESERKEMREFNKIEINGIIYSVDPDAKTFMIPREKRKFVGQVVHYDVFDLSKDINPDVLETLEKVVTQKDLDLDDYIKSNFID